MRVLVFDLDDTLMPEIAAVADAFAVTCRAARARCEPAFLAQAVRSRARDLWRTCPARAWCLEVGVSSWEGLAGPFDPGRAGEDVLAGWWVEYRERAWVAGLADCDVDDADLARALASAFAEEKRARYRAYEDAPAALDDLSRDHRLAILTNGASSIQRDKIERAGLQRWFEHVAVSGEIGRGKPHRATFGALLDTMGVRPADAVMIGDSARADIAGARAAGMRAVWVDRGGGEQPEAMDGRVRTLSALRAVLGDLPLSTETR